MPEIKSMPAKEIVSGFTGRFLHGERSTLASWEIKSGCIMPSHDHPHEQITYIIEGELEMQIGGVTHNFRAGSVYVIPPNTRHGAIAKTDCRVLDFFAPAREDYKI